MRDAEGNVSTINLCEHLQAPWNCPACRNPAPTGVGLIGIMNNHRANCTRQDCPVCEANKPRPLGPSEMIGPGIVPRADVERALERLGGKLEPRAEPLKSTLPERGWQCPVCNAVWAPFVRRCEGCK